MITSDETTQDIMVRWLAKARQALVEKGEKQRLATEAKQLREQEKVRLQTEAKSAAEKTTVAAALLVKTEGDEDSHNADQLQQGNGRGSGSHSGELTGVSAANAQPQPGGRSSRT